MLSSSCWEACPVQLREILFAKIGKWVCWFDPFQYRRILVEKYLCLHLNEDLLYSYLPLYLYSETSQFKKKNFSAKPNPHRGFQLILPETITFSSFTFPSDYPSLVWLPQNEPQSLCEHYFLFLGVCKVTKTNLPRDIISYCLCCGWLVGNVIKCQLRGENICCQEIPKLQKPEKYYLQPPSECVMTLSTGGCLYAGVLERSASNTNHLDCFKRMCSYIYWDVYIGLLFARWGLIVCRERLQTHYFWVDLAK